MPSINGPFHSLFYPDYNGDRIYSDEDFGLPFQLDHSNGVYLNQSTQALQIAAAGDMNLAIRAGYCFIEGHFGGTPQDGSITLDNADGTHPRIDRIVMRHYGSGGELDERKLAPLVLTGTPAQNPKAPDIVRNGTYYDLSLATVLVPAGAIEITNANITDTRFDTSVCGAVTGKNENPLDTTELFAQFQDRFDQLMDQIRDTLGEDAATNLLNLINGQTQRLTDHQRGMVGSISATARASAPPGWLLCQGQAVSRETYSLLFEAIGTAYGAGDGSATFQLPDIRGRVPAGKAASGTFGALNNRGGSETASAPLPSHSHTMPSVSVKQEGTNKYNSGNGISTYSVYEGGDIAGTKYNAYEHVPLATQSATTGSTGSGGSHNNLQPYITVNYIIYAGV